MGMILVWPAVMQTDWPQCWWDWVSGIQSSQLAMMLQWLFEAAAEPANTQASVQQIWSAPNLPHEISQGSQQYSTFWLRRCHLDDIHAKSQSFAHMAFCPVESETSLNWTTLRSGIMMKNTEYMSCRRYLAVGESKQRHLVRHVLT